MMRYANGCYGENYKVYDKYVNPRFYLTPDTRELILQMSRTFGATFNTSQPNIKLEVRRRACVTTDCFTWNAYCLDEERRAHFQIPEELTTDANKFPKGFYDIKVFANDCHVSDIEMVKAPGYYVNMIKVNETDGSCDNALWCEPTCESGCTKHQPYKCPNEKSSGACGCEGVYKDNCPSCLKKQFIAEVNLQPGYGA